MLMLMLTVTPLIVAQQIAGAAREFSQAAMSHASEPGALDIALAVLGVAVVIVTTIYSVLFLVRPGETAEHHIKRRILEDETREPR